MSFKKTIQWLVGFLFLVWAGYGVLERWTSPNAEPGSDQLDQQTGGQLAGAGSESGEGAAAGGGTDSQTSESQNALAKDPHAGTPLTDEERNTTVKTKDLKVGNTKIVATGSQVSFHTIMKLRDGKVIFNSYAEGKPWSGVIGNGSLILGLDMGLRGMFQGGKRALWIPPHMAYGKWGVNPQVPPNAHIYAEVEMLSVF